MTDAHCDTSSPTIDSDTETVEPSGYLLSGTAPGLAIIHRPTNLKHAQPKMSPTELRRAMGRTQLTVMELSYHFGETAVQVQRWRHGKDEIPGYVAAYIRLIDGLFAAEELQTP